MVGGMVREGLRDDHRESAVSLALIPGLRELWAETLGDPGVVIAVLDGPVDRAHPAFAGADLERVESLAPTLPDPTGRATAHGTAVASLIFGQHGPDSPAFGVAPRCRGLLVPIFRDAVLHPSGGLACSQLDLARALTLAAEHGADVINVSGGEFAPSGQAHPLLADAVRQCAERGILIVAAAGNDGCACLHVPAALPGVLAVGAMTLDGEPLETSNWCDAYRSAGLLAPGANLLAARAGGGTVTASGTSAAAAIVSGAAGLLLSLARAGKKPHNGQVVGKFLLDTAQRCLDDSMRCRRQLAGRLDLETAASTFQVKGPFMSDESLVHASGLPAGEAGAATVAPQAPEPVPGVVPSAGCGCESCRARAAAAGGGTESGPAPGSLVFALGQLDYDLVSDTRRYSLQQHIWEHRHQFHGVACDPSRLPTPAEANPHDPEHLLDYLEHEANCWDSAAVQWVLKIRQTPIYAIQPWGPFAREIYAWLRTTLREHMTRRDEERVEWVSIPGRLAGQVKLFNGQYVPVIIPEPRGLYSWNLVALLRKLIDAGKPEKSTAGKPEKSDTGKLEKIEQVREFLDRVYHDLRNLGLTSRDRALNYAATNAAQVGSVFDSVLAAKEPMALDSIDAAPSPECLPGADCWDVKIHFFYPERPAPSVRKVYSFTVDVSDMVPVMVGPRRSWHER